MLDSLEITVDYLGKMQEQITIMDLNINVSKHDITKKNSSYC
jgi:hypothetical protein